MWRAITMAAVMTMAGACAMSESDDQVSEPDPDEVTAVELYDSGACHDYSDNPCSGYDPSELEAVHQWTKPCGDVYCGGSCGHSEALGYRQNREQLVSYVRRSSGGVVCERWLPLPSAAQGCGCVEE